MLNRSDEISWFGQIDFDVRCEWGEEGLKRLGSLCDVVVIVDAMSFSTCVSAAVSVGATVYPHQFKDTGASEKAKKLGAELASSRGAGLLSLSPTTMLNLKPGMRLVLPSRNGAVLSLAAQEKPIFAGCFRNASAVAKAASKCGKTILVVPAGERWLPESLMRPGLEDWLAAGAVISNLPGSRSAEAEAAATLFEACRSRLREVLGACGSGRELRWKGFEKDLDFIAALDADAAAPRFINGCYAAM